jgi:outer membrane protein assembly factor BamD
MIALLGASLLFSGCGRKAKTTAQGDSAEPDKVLYERGLDDIAHGRHVVGRLTLQTLINTYPDSEYLAKAKLAVADSFYKEGGSAGLTQAIAEYKDFITFFEFLADEAAYAQMQVGMAHFRRMEKPDRDRTWARLAEDEFQRFLIKYPDHPRAAEAEQRLREVQEVLAEGDYRIARYYFIKGSVRAAGGRLLEMVDRYPLYSNADRSLMMLGACFEKSERGDIGARYYARLVRDYPLSELVPEAKARLEHLGVPIPQPDPAALERMTQEQNAPRRKRGIMGRALGMIKSGPDVTTAAQAGKPNLNPPSQPGGEPNSPGGITDVTAAPGGVSGTTGGSSTIQGTQAESAPGTGSVAPAAAGATAPGPGAEPSTSQLVQIDPKKAKAIKRKEEEERKRREAQEKKQKELEESSSKRRKP